MPAVRFDRGRADRQPLGDLFVAVAFRDQLKDLPLALRERIVAVYDAFVCEALYILVEHDSRDGRTEEGLALGDRGNGGNQIRADRILQQISFGAGTDRPGDV